MHVWSKLSDAKWNDAWEERFHALEDTSLVITDFPDNQTVRVEVYCEDEAQAAAIKAQFGGSIRRLANRDWVAFSAPEIAPIRIRERFLVTSERDPAKLAELAAAHPGRAFITIPAEMAFGTGDHATTATCLRFLCDLHAQGELPEDFSCLDLGCGSGILAIAAAKTGASPVAGFDFDPAAVRIATANAEANSAAVDFAECDVLKWEPAPGAAPYDLVFANLFSGVLQAAFPTIRQVMAPGGHLIVSGILDKHAAETIDAAADAHLHVVETRQRGKWVTAHAVLRDRPRPDDEIRV